MSSEKENRLCNSVHHPPEAGRWVAVKHFLVIFLPLLALTGGIMTALYYTEEKTERIILETNEAYDVYLHKRIILGDFKPVVPDLMFLSEHLEIKKMFADIEGNYKNSLKGITHDFLIFSKKKGLYDQISFLNERGMELVRVNFNNGMPYVVSENQLQFKGDCYYFKETIELEQGEVYVSPFDLDVEREGVVHPPKPMIRLGTPVFDSHGQKQGAVVLNYLGEKLFHDFNRMHVSTQSHTMLLNSDGYWLKGLKPEDEWGFMYEDGKNRTFGNAFPDAWQRISNEESGQFYNKDGLFTFGTVYPLLEIHGLTTGMAEALDTISSEAKAYSWKIVTYASSDVLKAGTLKLLGKYSLVFAVLVMILGVVSWVLARVRISHKLAEEKKSQCLKELESVNQELTDFAYIVSHDLKAPLRAISSLSTWISTDYADKFDEDGKNQMGLLLGRVNRMHNLIDGILQYSRIGRIREKMVDVDLNKLVAEVIDMIAPPENIEINVENKLPSIKCEKTRIEQVFQNLLSNAVKFMDKQKGEIKVICVEDDSYWKFSVGDNGPGIEEKYFEKIFLIFQTLSPRDEVEGTGIGLTVVKKIVETFGGKIWVESKVGHGSTFFFTLPKNIK